MNPELHTHLPDSAGFVIAIIVGLLLLLFGWFAAVPIIGWGWAIFIGIVGVGLIGIGFLKLLIG